MWNKQLTRNLKKTFAVRKAFFSSISFFSSTRVCRGAERGGRGVQWPRGPWASEKPLAHRNDTEKSACEAGRPFFFYFGDHLIPTEKTVFVLKPLEFRWRPFFFWRWHHFSDLTTAFSPSILDFTKPKIRHILAGPWPTFGPRRHCASVSSLLNCLWSKRWYNLLSIWPR